jgi:hypothetical protein
MSHKWTLEEVLWKITDEGLGECVENYFASDTFTADHPELAVLWANAEKALQDIYDYFEEEGLWMEKAESFDEDPDDEDNEED